MQYEMVIGLEIHLQLNTKTKMYCGCSTKHGDEHNTNTCPVCLGMPGVLPNVNKQAVEYAVLLAHATDCNVNLKSEFDRKNYFYPDLPKGYQITQQRFPIAEDGIINVDGSEIRIERIHMEEEAGKSFHLRDRQGAYTLVDMNRCGVPLLEMVTRPDIRSPEEATNFIRKVKRIVEYLGICDGNMEEGNLRVDANISVRKQGETKLGQRSEIKNINSFRHIRRALEFEYDRHIELLEKGEQILFETRLYNEKDGRTHSMRSKEGANDYRYFPEPDLPPLKIEQSFVDSIKEQLPELPEIREKRFVEQYNLASQQAEVMTSTMDFADFFEDAVAKFGDSSKVAGWLQTEMLARINVREGIPISADNLCELLTMLQDDKITNTVAKKVFTQMLEKGGKPSEIVKSMGASQISDEDALIEIARGVLDSNPNEVQKYLDGKTNVIGFFVGQAMRQSRGKANPKMMQDIFTQLLAEKQ